MPTEPTRPAVSVVLPFHGDAVEADAALAALATLELRAGDEVLVADNTEAGTLLRRPGAAAVTAFPSPVARSAYAARNVAAERAANAWLLLLDADVRPPPDLLDRYFDTPPGERTGAVAGQVLGVPDQPGRIPRYIRSRRHLDQEWLQHEHPHRPMAVTANLLVRRAALAEIGGMAELTRSGADADLCWRLLDAGWELELRLGALVHHEHRASLGALLRQSARDGAGARWLSRRHPGFAPRPSLRRELPRAVGGSVVWALRGERERAHDKLVDGLWALAAVAGSLQANAAPVDDAPARAVVLVERFPVAATTLPPGRVEALRRPARQDWTAGRTRTAHLVEDDGAVTRLRAAARLLAAHPRAAARELGSPGSLALAPAAARLLDDPRTVTLHTTAARAADAERITRLAGRPDLPYLLFDA